MQHLEHGRRREALRAASSWVTALLCLAGAAGCQAPDASEDGDRSPGTAASPSAGLAPGADWRAWAEAESQRVAREDPASFQALGAMVPITTRGGKLRFLTPVVRRPGAAPVLLSRLARKADPPPVRRAIVEVLPFTGGPYAEAIGDLLAGETEPSVRAELAAILERAPLDTTSPAVRRALADTDPQVRAAALFAVAGRADGASYTDAIVSALSASDPDARRAAIHAAGVLRLGAAKPALRALIAGRGAHGADALLALFRVDPEETRARGDLDELAVDPALAPAVARVRGEAP